MKVSAFCEMEIHIRDKGDTESDQMPHEAWYSFDVPSGYLKAFEKAVGEKDKRMVLQASLKHKLIDKLLRAEFVPQKKKAICRTLIVRDYKVGDEREIPEAPEVVQAAAVVKKKTRAAKVVK